MREPYYYRGHDLFGTWVERDAAGFALPFTFNGDAGPLAVVTATPIQTDKPFYRQSAVGTSVLPDFQGGTLRIDQNGAIDQNNYTVENFATNTIDLFGHSIVFAGSISGSGPLTISNSAGGGTLTVTQLDNIDGALTIDSGARLQWGDGQLGFLLGNAGLSNNGTLIMDIGISDQISLSSAISGSGSVILESGALSTTATNTYGGPTIIDSAARLFLVGSGSIATSSAVVNDGIFDISGTSAGATIETLSGSGLVNLGSQTLTIANPLEIFSGVIADGGASGGTGGGLTVASALLTLTGTNTFTGATTIGTAAVLQLGAGGATGTVAGSIVDDGRLRFNYSGAVTLHNSFSGDGSVEVASGTVIVPNPAGTVGFVTIDPGARLQFGAGSFGFLLGTGNIVTDNGTLSINCALSGFVSIFGSGKLVVQSGSLSDGAISTYTGSTTIAANALLLLLDGGSIANSSMVVDKGTFDISATSASIVSLKGSGVVNLGAQTLTITGASGIFSGILEDGGTSGGAGGNLRINGGTQILTGTETFTGETIVNAATLQLGNGGTTGTVSGPIQDVGLVRFDYSGPVTFDGTIIGSGNVEIAAGTLIVTKESAVGGNVTIDRGATLQWGQAAFMASDVGGVIDNGMLAIDGGTSPLVVGLPIFGSGKVAVKAGTFTEIEPCTYTGSTVIDSAASLFLELGGSISSSSGLVDNGILDVSETFAGTSLTKLTGSGKVLLGSRTLTLTHASGTFSGVIADDGLTAGSGSLTIAGGKQILTGNSTFMGVTTIASGAILQLGSGGATGKLGGAVDVADNATLKILHSAGTAESITLSLGTNSVVTGGAGTETFRIAASNLKGTDTVDGGTGAAIDRLLFTTAGTVDASAFANVSHIEKLVLANGANTIVLSDALVGASDKNHLLSVTGGNGSDIIDASAVTTIGNRVNIAAGGGDDTITGGSQADTLNGGAGNDRLSGGAGDDILVSGSGNDTVTGAGGNDTIRATNQFNAKDSVDGGKGIDTLALSGDYSAGIVFHAATLVNVETIQLADGFSYKLTPADATVAAGQSLTIDGTALGAGHSLIVNGAKETDGTFVLEGGGGNDILTGGASGDTLDGGARADTLTGRKGADFLTPGNGNDVLKYGSAADSTSVHFDTVQGFVFGSDTFDIPGSGSPISGIDAAVNSGTLSKASFDSDLSAALSGHLHAHHAELFTASAGGFAGETFLVVDLNGKAGYQANADLVIHLTGETGTLTAGDFI